MVAAEGTEDMAVGNDVLAAAAAPLLQLMARLRNTANAPDLGDLYQRTVRQIRVFEQEARDKGVPSNSFVRLTTRCAPASTTSC